jgi:large repetitive protein
MFQNLTTQAKIRIVLVALVLATLPCYFAGFIAIRSFNQRTQPAPIADLPDGSATDGTQGQNITLAAPGLPDLAASSDTGVSNTDNVTSVTTPQFTGICTNGEKINLNSNLNGLLSPADTVCVSSSYTITVSSPLNVGVHNITATASDDQGNASPPSSALNLEIVTANDAAPGTPDLAGDSDTGLSNVDNITQDNTPRLTGICTDGDKINLTSSINGALSPVDSLCSGGLYDITLGSILNDGVHNITATALDPAGNTSSASGAIGVTIDTAPPTIPGTPDLVAGSDTGSSDSDNITSDITPQFVGSCAQGDTITINSSYNGLQIPTATCSANRYDITLLSNLSEVNHTITAIATDVAGNNSTSTGLTVVVETATPNAPGTPDLHTDSDSGTSNNDNLTNDTTPRFTGTCSGGDTITIVSSVHGNLLPTGPCANGIYDITLNSVLNSSQHMVTAMALSAVGNLSYSLGLDMTIDTAAPAAPSTPDLAAGSDTGVSNTDNITSDTTPQFTGTCTTGNLITIKSAINGNLVPQTSCASGTYAITVSNALNEDSHDITATASDAAGNNSPPSGLLEISIDNTAPNAPGTPDLAAGSDSGRSDSDNITSDNTPRFTGTCNDGDKIFLRSSVDGNLDPEDTVCAGGVYDITLTSILSQATHSITARARDAQFNTSGDSGGLNVVIDITAPAAPGTPDLASGSDSGSSDADNITNINTPCFTGTCENDATVTLNSSVEGTLAPTGTCSGGGFDITLSSTLSETSHNISAQQVDAAGNSSGDSGALGISIDTSAPGAPGTPDLADGSDTGASNSDNITSDTTPQFVGACEDGSTVTINAAGFGDLSPTGTCSGGVYDITLNALSEDSYDLTAEQSDTAGNSGPDSGLLEVRIEIPTLTISLSGNTGADSVTSTGGSANPGDLSCPSVRCDVTYALDDNVTLNVSVDAASTFQAWSGDCAAWGSSLSGIITLNGDKNCTATFAGLTYPEMDVEGNGSSIPDGDNSPDAGDHTDFGSVSLGGSQDRTFTIQNEGSNTLNLTAFPTAVTLSGSGDFSVQSQPSAGSIASGGADLTFVVRCTPSGLTTETTTVSIANNDSDENPYDFVLSCTGGAAPEPEMDVEGNGTSIGDGDATPDSGDHTDFGSVSLGSSMDRTFNIQNEGGGTLNLTAFPTAVTLSGSGDFSVLTQPSAGSIASGGGDLSFVVRCTPSAASTVTTTVSIANDDTDENPYDFMLSCTGSAVSAPEIDLQRPAGNSLADGGTDNLGAQAVGTVNLRYIIDNSAGSDTLDVSGVGADNFANVSSFSLNTGMPLSIPAGDSAEVDIAFDISGSGAFSMDLDIANTDSDENPYDIQISGTGADVAEMEVYGDGELIFNGDDSPDTDDHTDFGTVDRNGAWGTRSFVISNTGSQDLNLSGSVAISGTHAGDFSLVVDATTPVPAGDEASFMIRFTPSDSGVREAIISIASDDSDENPYTFSIQGTGGDPAAEIEVSGNGVPILTGDDEPDTSDDTDFGDADVAAGLVTHTFTITNSGSLDLNLSGSPIVVIGGTHAADFILTTDATTPVSSGGGTVTFQISFNPSDAGQREATITVSSDDADEGTYTFSIQGNGTN